MKLNNITILILFALILCSCNETRKRKNEIHKITLLTGECYGFCPTQCLQIDSSLTLKYHGDKYAKRPGYYIGKITQSNWDTINAKFEKINYKELDSAYNHSVDDSPTYIEIKYDNKVKIIRAQSSSLPEEVEKTYYWLVELCNKIALTKTTDTLDFDNDYLNYVKPPPPPIRPPIITRHTKKSNG